MDFHVSTMVTLIENKKTKLKDCDYKELLETLSEINKKCGKGYYTFTFQLIETSLNAEDDNLYFEIDMDIQYKSFDFHIDTELYLSLNSELENQPLRSVHHDTSVDAGRINSFMKHFRNHVSVEQGGMEFSMKRDILLTNIKKNWTI